MILKVMGESMTCDSDIDVGSLNRLVIFNHHPRSSLFTLESRSTDLNLWLDTKHSPAPGIASSRFTKLVAFAQKLAAEIEIVRQH